MICLLAGLVLGLGALPTDGAEEDRYDHFRERVLPLLKARCFSCHGPEKQKGGLRLDSRASILRGGETGPALVPGDPAGSLLLKAVRHAAGDLVMPPKEKLGAPEIEHLARWIREGAPWPDPAQVLFEGDASILSAPAEGNGAARLSPGDGYAGRASLLVTTQRSCPIVPGWSFVVSEHPREGEVRYLRFAWKKRGGGAIFFELANQGQWRSRTEANAAWVAGANTTGWEAAPVGPEAPSEWQVVTRDLWKDRGTWKSFRVTGFCLTAVDGGEALLGWVIAGPTVESLDAHRPGRGAVREAASREPGRVGDAWSDARNPIVRIFGGQRLGLWSLRKVARPDPPAGDRALGALGPIDRFLQAARGAVGLSPSPEADRRTLIRRLSFDLAGLPPAPEEVKAFLENPSPFAYEELVDRLLASPRYGERWARHWLDVVRYAETNGFERDEFQPQIYRYRDYVIQALNQDKPFDVFIREQLAGDEMVPGAPRDAADLDRLVATGYLRMGPFDSTGSIFEENAKNRNELMTDLANTTGSAFLGLTMACANCHDHKYDPISQADHFRLRAFFAGVKRQDDTVLDLAPVQEEIRAENAKRDLEIAELEKEVSAILSPIRKALLEERRSQVPAELRALLDLPKEQETPEIREKIKPFREKLKIQDPEVESALPEEGRKKAKLLRERIAGAKAGRRGFVTGMTARDSGTHPAPTQVFYQGDFTQPREEVPPGFLSVLDPNPAAIEPPPGGASSGRRTALARWIASPENPLTARVIVNRLWHHHFGRGLVGTPNDFGFSGARPTHPELLDYLAGELVRGGWSLKRMHRMILLSQAYRQSSLDRPLERRRDPENLLLWRQNPRRLDAESTRDAILAVSGALLGKSSGRSVWPPVPQHMLDAEPGILEAQHDKAAQERLQGWFTDPLEATDVRSIFLVQKRALGIPFLRPFDLPDSTVSCGRRDCTTVAPQALQLLNSPLGERAALAFAQRLEREAREGERIERAVWLALGRAPTPAELRLGQGVVDRKAGALVDWCRVLLNVNEFVYVD